MISIIRTVKVFLCLVMVLGLSACVSSYEQTIEQGNQVSQEALALLQPGMNKAEVRAVLGAPLSSNLFNDERWEYYYSKAKLSAKERESSVFTLYFKNELLSDIKGSVNWTKIKGFRNAPIAKNTGGTVITKPTTKEKGIFSGLFKKK